MGKATNAAGVEVWVDEGHGRLGIVDITPFGFAQISVSANDGRVIGGFVDDTYEPARGPLVLPQFVDLEPGAQVYWRAETARQVGADEHTRICDLPDREVVRHFTTLTIVPDGVDEPPPRPRPKTREVPNEDTPPPARAKRYGPSHRDGWDYAAVVGCVVHAYQQAGERPDLTAVRAAAWATIAASDLVQLALEGHVDRKSYSHARARAAVHAVIEKHPPPIFVEFACLRGWLFGVAWISSELLRIADDLAKRAES